MRVCATCSETVPSGADDCPSCGTPQEVVPFLAGGDDPWGATPAPATLPPPVPTLPDVSRASLPAAKKRFPTWAKVVIGLVALLVVLGAAAAFIVMRAVQELDLSDLQAAANGGELTAFEGDVALDGLTIGDCVFESAPVTCDQLHDLEVFHVVPSSDADYPSFDAVFDVSAGECTDAFESYVGIDYFESEFFLDAYPSSASAWEAGDRVIRCVAYDPFGQLTFSVRGAGS